MTASGTINIESLNTAVAASRRSGLGKIMYAPGRMIRSKIVERWCLMRKTASPAVATTFWGEPMNVVLPEHVSITIYRYGFFENELTRIFLQRMKPGMTFFDVGSHFGFFSLLAARLVGPTGRVRAFEPTPSTFAMVEGNLRGRPNCKAVNVAAWRTDETLEFSDFGVAHSAFNSLFSGKLAEGERAAAHATKVKVSARSLDSYCKETGELPDFLKIDTEGAEGEVLEGMRWLLSTKRPVFTLEVGDKAGDNDMTKSRDVVNKALSMGYRALELKDGALVPHVLQERYAYGNILFEPV